MSYKKVDNNHKILVPYFAKERDSEQRRHSICGYDYLSDFVFKNNNNDDLSRVTKDGVTKASLDMDDNSISIMELDGNSQEIIPTRNDLSQTASSSKRIISMRSITEGIFF